MDAGILKDILIYDIILIRPIESQCSKLYLECYDK